MDAKENQEEPMDAQEKQELVVPTKFIRDVLAHIERNQEPLLLYRQPNYAHVL